MSIVAKCLTEQETGEGTNRSVERILTNKNDCTITCPHLVSRMGEMKTVLAQGIIARHKHFEGIQLQKIYRAMTLGLIDSKS